MSEEGISAEPKMSDVSIASLEWDGLVMPYQEDVLSDDLQTEFKSPKPSKSAPSKSSGCGTNYFSIASTDSCEKHELKFFTHSLNSDSFYADNNMIPSWVNELKTSKTVSDDSTFLVNVKLSKSSQEVQLILPPTQENIEILPKLSRKRSCEEWVNSQKCFAFHYTSRPSASNSNITHTIELFEHKLPKKENLNRENNKKPARKGQHVHGASKKVDHASVKSLPISALYKNESDSNHYSKSENNITSSKICTQGTVSPDVCATPGPFSKDTCHKVKNPNLQVSMNQTNSSTNTYMTCDDTMSSECKDEIIYLEHNRYGSTHTNHSSKYEDPYFISPPITRIYKNNVCGPYSLVSVTPSTSEGEIDNQRMFETEKYNVESQNPHLTNCDVGIPGNERREQTSILKPEIRLFAADVVLDVLKLAISEIARGAKASNVRSMTSPHSVNKSKHDTNRKIIFHKNTLQDQQYKIQLNEFVEKYVNNMILRSQKILLNGCSYETDFRTTKPNKQQQLSHNYKTKENKEIHHDKQGSETPVSKSHAVQKDGKGISIFFKPQKEQMQSSYIDIGDFNTSIQGNNTNEPAIQEQRTLHQREHEKMRSFAADVVFNVLESSFGEIARKHTSDDRSPTRQQKGRLQPEPDSYNNDKNIIYNDSVEEGRYRIQLDEFVADYINTIIQKSYKFLRNSHRSQTYSRTIEDNQLHNSAGGPNTELRDNEHVSTDADVNSQTIHTVDNSMTTYSTAQQEQTDQAIQTTPSLTLSVEQPSNLTNSVNTDLFQEVVPKSPRRMSRVQQMAWQFENNFTKRPSPDVNVPTATTSTYTPEETLARTVDAPKDNAPETSSLINYQPCIEQPSNKSNHVRCNALQSIDVCSIHSSDSDGWSETNSDSSSIDRIFQTYVPTFTRMYKYRTKKNPSPS